MGEIDQSDIILVDADVLIHFFIAGEILRLGLVFPGKLRILDVVYEELARKRAFKGQLDNLLARCAVVKLMVMPTDGAVLREYAYIHNTLKRGKGEAACMAVAKHAKCAIASSNLTDVADYCATMNIRYYTTMDVLYEALQKGVMNEPECDAFIAAVLGVDDKLPVKKMKDYIIMVKKGHRYDLYGIAKTA